MPTAKKVKVSIDPVGNSGRYKLTVSPLTVWIKTAGEQVVWESDEADLTVSFAKNGTPFSLTQFSANASTQNAASGEPNHLLPNQRVYSYYLTIVPNPAIANGKYGNMGPITIDPDVVVDDAGPPEGGARKKAARKSKGRSNSRRGRR